VAPGGKTKRAIWGVRRATSAVHNSPKGINASAEEARLSRGAEQSRSIAAFGMAVEHAMLSAKHGDNSRVDTHTYSGIRRLNANCWADGPRT
jgi:hypothetical protein